MSSKRKKGFPFLTVLVLIGAVVGVGWYGKAEGGWFEEAESGLIKGVPVKKGPLRISVIERGNLSSAESASLRNEMEGRSTILSLIAEGTWVEEGEIVCELDVSSQIDERVQQEITVRNAEADTIKAKQAYEIQVSQNESDIARALQSLEFARIDVEQYEKSTRPLEEKRAEEAITIADEEFERAKNDLRWTEELAEKGFVTQLDLEADRLALQRSEISKDQAVRELDAMREFDFPKQVATLKGNLEEAERELKRVELQAAARLVDFEATQRTSEAKFELEKEKLIKIDRQIETAVMRAPVSGMVVYARSERSRYGGGDPMEEGLEVRERQEIITIPQSGGMIAEASLHESVLKQVHSGLPVVVKVDAIPGREFQGTVEFVALLPDQGSWMSNPNVRLFKTRVRIFDTVEEMRPGMSCSIEVLVEDIAETLYIPSQSHFRDGLDDVVFVDGEAGIQKRKVVLGRYNDKWIQVLEGVEEGEIVYLSAPPDFSPKATPDESGDRTDFSPPEGHSLQGSPLGQGVMGSGSMESGSPGGNPGGRPSGGSTEGGRREGGRPAGSWPGSGDGGGKSERSGSSGRPGGAPKSAPKGAGAEATGSAAPGSEDDR